MSHLLDKTLVDGDWKKFSYEERNRKMGYYSHLEGSFEIFPAPPKNLLKWNEIKNNPKVHWGHECMKVNFNVESSTEYEPDGTEVIRNKVVTVTIDVVCEGSHKHYYVAETLQEIVNMLGRDRQYKGYFEGMGEDGDQWRYAIVNGVVKDFKPTITWPPEAS